MDHAGIEKSVICSIATKPTQSMPILQWSQSIASARIIPFASVHPDDPEITATVKLIKASGIKGIKMHPYYQRFIFNEKRMYPFYEAIVSSGLIFICHTGFDIAFPHDRIVDPEKISDIVKRFPEMQFVATHFGAWRDWEEVEKHLIGREIYLEISYTMGILPDEKMAALLSRHPGDFLLFGTDSPWEDQKTAVEHLNSLRITDILKEKMLFTNAKRLLRLTD
jgi:predicted TIM-barrel fold metal-dependent hydrolase